MNIWLTSWFSWPGGQLWPNVAAAPICTVGAWLVTRSVRKLMKKHHRENLAHADVLHKAATEQRAEHHAELKKHLGIDQPEPAADPGELEYQLVVNGNPVCGQPTTKGGYCRNKAGADGRCKVHS